MDAAADASSSSSGKANSASDAKKVRVACDTLPAATPDQLRDVMSLLVRLSQNDADHVRQVVKPTKKVFNKTSCDARQVLLANPELSLALSSAAERLQLLDQPLKHIAVQPPVPTPAVAAAAAGGTAQAPGAFRQPPHPSAPPPPPVNLPIEVQQALEMLLREYGPSLQIYTPGCSYLMTSVTRFSAQASCSIASCTAWRRSTSFANCRPYPKTACAHWAGKLREDFKRPWGYVFILNIALILSQVWRAAVADAWVDDEECPADPRAAIRSSLLIVGDRGWDVVWVYLQ